MLKKLLLTSCLFFSSYAQADKQALLVGVSDYRGDRDDLMGIDIDISKMKRLLHSWGFKVKVLYNSDSMKIDDSLQNYADNLNPNDTFAFYYSGHGSYAVDMDGDESDGQDESIVLSDGVTNEHFLDDEINHYLNRIKARKLVMFDSCHSGTANKGRSQKIKPKTLPSRLVTKVHSKGIKVYPSELKDGEYIFLGASKDYEQSLATSGGSLFTNGIYNLLSTPNGMQKSLESIREELTYGIRTFCKQNSEKPHHPNLLASSESFKNGSVSSYLKTGVETRDTLSLQDRLEQILSSTQNRISITHGKSSYITNDRVNFSFDTNGQKGHLSVLFVDRSKVTVLYPNPRAMTRVVQGRYSFPKDFGNFGVKAVKKCDGCQKDKTDIYLLLTPQPLANIESMTRKELLSFAKGSSIDRVVSKDVELVYDEKPQNNRHGNVMIGKYSFWVE